MTHQQDESDAERKGNSHSIIERIDKALAEWAAECGERRPDTIFLGTRDAFALDRALNMFCMRYKGMDVTLTNQVMGLALARVY
jgi:hypothetical protein